jgi:hypothetical protein
MKPPLIPEGSLIVVKIVTCGRKYMKRKGESQEENREEGGYA